MLLQSDKKNKQTKNRSLTNFTDNLQMKHWEY